jgi:hypothetical protein
MSDCPDEHRTQHYRGEWHGFGPVMDSERVIFAVFEKTKSDGNHLAQDSFDNNSLKNLAQSLARDSLVTRPTGRKKNTGTSSSFTGWAATNMPLKIESISLSG